MDQTNSQLFGQGIVQRPNPVTQASGSVRQTAFSNDFIKNANVFTSSALTLTNGNSLVVQSIVTSNTNPNIKLAAVPYSIVFFQGSLNTSDMIGVTITGAGYQMKGPQAMPVFSPNAQNLSGSTIYGGSTGSNLVFVTELYNNTGSTQTIYYITNTRFVQSGGGAS